MEVMNVYPFASGGRAAGCRCSKDEAGGNDPTVAAGFSCSPDERQRHPGPAAAPHIAIAHAGYGVHENPLTCRNPLIPFVLRTQNAINLGAPPCPPPLPPSQTRPTAARDRPATCGCAGRSKRWGSLMTFALSRSQR